MKKLTIQSTTPHWSRHAVVYQIYPRSFKDKSGDGVGDLRGIIEKLDYLNDGTEKSLGINAIWLSPIYKSPMRDWGYDVSNYYGVDPIFGNLATFDRLVKKAHRQGIKIIMDFVPNHTSSEHPWFIESRSSKNNSKRNWYIWRDPKPDGSPPNNWLSQFGGSAWEFDKNTAQYYLHTFLPQQPDLNWQNKEVVGEMKKILLYWIERGVDGFRLDAIGHLAKHKDLLDEPQNPFYNASDNPYNKLLHVYSGGVLEIIPIIENFCKVVGKERFMLGEISPSLEKLPEFYKACLDKIHIPFNFNLIKLSWDAIGIKEFIDTYDKTIGEENLPNYVLGNHDVPRALSRIGKEKIRIAAMLLLTLRGVPVIYYGEEIGMENVKISLEQIRDPLEKRVPGFGLGRDPERTPMQWDGTRYAGFSQVKPWLPLAENYAFVNVGRNLSDPQSLLNLYRCLIHFRKQSPALLSGNYSSFNTGKKNIFSFLRQKNKEKVLVVLNFSDRENRLSFDFSNARLVCTTYMDKESNQKINLNPLFSRPYEGIVVTF